MDKIRVLVANRPRLMREVVGAIISGQPDIDIVGEIQNDTEIPSAVEETHPDVLIVSLEEDSDERPVVCDFVLEKHPQIRVLAIAPNRDTIIAYSAGLEIRANPIETSEQAVLDAVRGRDQARGRSL